MPVYVDFRPVASKQQPASKRGQKLNLPFGVLQPPRMGPGTPSNHLRVWLHPIPVLRVFRPPGVRPLANLAQFGQWPQAGPEGSGMGAGGRGLGRNLLGQRVGSLLLLLVLLSSYRYG